MGEGLIDMMKGVYNRMKGPVNYSNNAFRAVAVATTISIGGIIASCGGGSNNNVEQTEQTDTGNTGQTDNGSIEDTVTPVVTPTPTVDEPVTEPVITPTVDELESKLRVYAPTSDALPNSMWDRIADIVYNGTHLGAQEGFEFVLPLSLKGESGNLERKYAVSGILLSDGRGYFSTKESPDLFMGEDTMPGFSFLFGTGATLEGETHVDIAEYPSVDKYVVNDIISEDGKVVGYDIEMTGRAMVNTGNLNVYDANVPGDVQFTCNFKITDGEGGLHIEYTNNSYPDFIKCTNGETRNWEFQDLLTLQTTAHIDWNNKENDSINEKVTTTDARVDSMSLRDESNYTPNLYGDPKNRWLFTDDSPNEIKPNESVSYLKNGIVVVDIKNTGNTPVYNSINTGLDVNKGLGEFDTAQENVCIMYNHNKPTCDTEDKTCLKAGVGITDKYDIFIPAQPRTCEK